MTWHKAQACCCVCGDPVTKLPLLPASSSDQPVCSDLLCQRLLDQGNTMPDHLYRAHFQFQQGRIKERKAKDKLQAQWNQALLEQQTAENAQAVQQVLASNPTLSLDSIEVINIPTGLPQLMPMSEARGARYSENIQRAIAEARQYCDASELPQDQHANARNQLAKVEARLQSNPKLKIVSDKLCMQCKGGCCSAGEDHAFLSAAYFRRQFDEGCSLTDEQLLQRFLDLLPPDSIEGSCINNTDTGCAIPRALRSDVCNGYFCDDIRQFQKRLAADTDLPYVIAVQRDYTQWNRFDQGLESKVTDVTLINSDCF